MKIKTNELTGAALDWAVAKCEQPKTGYKSWVQRDLDAGILHGMHYSTDWLFSGPIIEREGISLCLYGDSKWEAHVGNKAYQGPTPLIAAMRCYVASKLGDEVEIPEALETAQEAV